MSAEDRIAAGFMPREEMLDRSRLTGDAQILHPFQLDEVRAEVAKHESEISRLENFVAERRTYATVNRGTLTDAEEAEIQTAVQKANAALADSTVALNKAEGVLRIQARHERDYASAVTKRQQRIDAEQERARKRARDIMEGRA